MIRRPPQALWRQRGAVAVEAAIALPILIGVGLLGTDLQRIHAERIRLENAAGAMAINLAAQTSLTSAGVDALAEAAMQGHEDMQHMIVLNVLQSGRVAWALQRGEALGLCDASAQGGRYSGTLPEDPPEGMNPNGEDTSTLSLIVVKACRDTSDIVLSGGLVMPGVLKTTTVFRAARKTVALDATLQLESDASGLAFKAR